MSGRVRAGYALARQRLLAVGRAAVTARRVLAACTLVAVVATLGSLYFSEVMLLFPCELCWYQRILMYPLVVVLGVAAYENRAGVWKTGLPLSTLGGGIAFYHAVLQTSAGSGLSCSVGGCGTVQWERAFLTIPRLSLTAFALLTAGLVTVAYLDRSGTLGR